MCAVLCCFRTKCCNFFTEQGWCWTHTVSHALLYNLSLWIRCAVGDGVFSLKWSILSHQRCHPSQICVAFSQRSRLETCFDSLLTDIESSIICFEKRFVLKQRSLHRDRIVTEAELLKIRQVESRFPSYCSEEFCRFSALFCKINNYEACACNQ